MATGDVAPRARAFQCKSCERKLPAGDFYASNLSRCKTCVKESVRANRREKADYYRAYDRKRYRDDPERAAHCKAMGKTTPMSERIERQRARRADDPQKFKARCAVNNAIRDGKIARGTECYFCGSAGSLHAHHEDYDHPLDVRWLCPSCHGKLHALKGDFRRGS